MSFCLPDKFCDGARKPLYNLKRVGRARFRKAVEDCHRAREDRVTTAAGLERAAIYTRTGNTGVATEVLAGVAVFWRDETRYYLARKRSRTESGRVPLGRDEVLDRYPRIVSHLICASLGYFTPEKAAIALENYRRGEPNFCEWYSHLAGGYSEERLREVGREVLERAIAGRHRHEGYMADYGQARALVEARRRGANQTGMLASWF